MYWLCIAIVFVSIKIWSTNSLLLSRNDSLQSQLHKEHVPKDLKISNDFQSPKWNLSDSEQTRNGTHFQFGDLINLNGTIKHEELALTSRHDLTSGIFTFGTKTYGLISLAVALIALQAIALRAYGQPPISKSGSVRIWHGSVLDDQNSQHLTDWYTFTHVLHGFLFYGILSFVAPSLPIQERFLVALGVEAGWEVLENSPFIIDRYRRTALAQGYTGDSILNSISDTFAMAFGFITAHLLPAWVVVALAVAEEVIVGLKIRDNFTMNVIQLIHPVKAISQWQQAGSRS